MRDDGTPAPYLVAGAGVEISLLGPLLHSVDFISSANMLRASTADPHFVVDIRNVRPVKKKKSTTHLISFLYVQIDRHLLNAHPDIPLGLTWSEPTLVHP